LQDRYTDMLVDGSELSSIGNELDQGLVSAFRNAVGNCDYRQKTVLSAIIAPYVEIVDEDEDIFKIDTEELELEEWSERYD